MAGPPTRHMCPKEFGEHVEGVGWKASWWFRDLQPDSGAAPPFAPPWRDEAGFPCRNVPPLVTPTLTRGANFWEHPPFRRGANIARPSGAFQRMAPPCGRGGVSLHFRDWETQWGRISFHLFHPHTFCRRDVSSDVGYSLSPQDSVRLQSNDVGKCPVDRKITKYMNMILNAADHRIAHTQPIQYCPHIRMDSRQIIRVQENGVVMISNMPVILVVGVSHDTGHAGRCSRVCQYVTAIDKLFLQKAEQRIGNLLSHGRAQHCCSLAGA